MRSLCRSADRTPTAVTIMGLLQTLTAPGAPIYFDHLAFRTFAVRHLVTSYVAVTLLLSVEVLLCSINKQCSTISILQ